MLSRDRDLFIIRTTPGLFRQGPAVSPVPIAHGNMFHQKRIRLLEARRASMAERRMWDIQAEHDHEELSGLLCAQVRPGVSKQGHGKEPEHTVNRNGDVFRLKAL